MEVDGTILSPEKKDFYGKLHAKGECILTIHFVIIILKFNLEFLAEERENLIYLFIQIV